MAKSTPVIFLAFANDRHDAVRYLRNLPQEARQLREVLRPAVEQGLCELVERANVSASDLFAVFQDRHYRDRIAVFHYGGHADGYQLLLESSDGLPEVAHAGGLAAFVAQQRGLQLVFLNACATQAQVAGLLEANASAVIATSRAVDDAVATSFATSFYRGLAGGATIGVAFGEAAAACRTQSEHIPDLYRQDERPGNYSVHADRLPWDLYVRPGAEKAVDWNLPDAADSPLFGLPLVPEGDLPAQPYRHLHWFAKEHAEVFFGREHQIREVYSLISAPGAAPIVLFSGPSGVGKSSFLEAGLLPRLESTREVRYARRRRSSGVLGTLLEALGGEGVSLRDKWITLESLHDRPLVVILDQVEEIFTRPMGSGVDELGLFIGALLPVFTPRTTRVRGRLLLSLRNEWAVELLRALEDRKLPYTMRSLPRLDARGIAAAVAGPCSSERLRSHYSLTIDPELPESIAADLIRDTQSPLAPTLQILLSKLWGQATARDRVHPRFDRDLYRQIVAEGSGLNDFLDQQLTQLERTHMTAVSSGLALDFLAFHTTARGTSEVRDAEALGTQYAHEKDLASLTSRCIDLYLLVAVDTVAGGDTRAAGQIASRTRLAHDTLAPLIRQRFEESDKPGQRGRRILESRAADWRDGHKAATLDEADLALVEQGRSGMRTWNDAEQRLVAVSRRRRTRAKTLRYVVQALAVVAVLAIGFTINLYRGQALETRLQTAKSHWTSGAAWRDQRNDPVRAAHLFAQAAMSPDQALADAARMAATVAIRGATLSGILYSDELGGAMSAAQEHRLLSWGEDTVQLWDTEIGTAVLPNSLQHNSVAGADLNADETLILSWGDGVQLWDAKTGAPLFPSVLQPDEYFLNASFSSDEKQILGLRAHGLHLWDRATGAVVFDKPMENLHDALLSPDGSRILVRAGERITMLNTRTGDSIFDRPEQDTGPLVSLSFSPDGRRILGFGEAGLWLLHAETGRPVVPEPLEKYGTGHGDDGVGGVFFGKGLLTFAGNRLQLRLAETGEPTLPHPLEHGGRVRGGSLNADLTQILSWGDDGIRVWDANTGTALLTPASEPAVPVTEANLNSDASLILSWGGSRIRVMDTRTGTISFDASAPDGDAVLEATFCNDDKHILSWNKNGIQLWDASTGLPLLASPLQHDGDIQGAHLSKAADRIVSWGSDNIRVWDIDLSQLPVAKRLGLSGSERAVALSHNGSRALTLGGEGVQLWNTNTGQSLLAKPLHDASASIASFSPDDSLILTSGADGVRVWHTDTGAAAFSESLSHDDAVRGAMFSPDGARVISWGADGIRVWDAMKGRPALKDLISHPKGVLGVWMNVPGSRILSWDGLDVEMWDANTGTRALDDAIPGFGVRGALFDEDMLVTWGREGVAKWWTSDRNWLPQLDAPAGDVNSATYDRNRGRVLTAGHLGIQLWEVDDWTPFFDPPLTHGRHELGAVFSSDERRILSWSATGATLWDAFTGVRLWDTPPGHAAAVRQLALNDGATRVVVLHDQTVSSYDTSYDRDVSAEALRLQIEVRTGTYVDAAGALRFFPEDEWRRKKAEYDSRKST